MSSRPVWVATNVNFDNLTSSATVTLPLAITTSSDPWAASIVEDNLVLVEPTAKEMEDEDEATTKRKSTQLPKMDWLIDQGIINIGDEVYLINHPEEIATIEDSRNVRYKDQVMSFNQFGCELTGWKAIQIYAFMKKVGGDKTLSKLREEKMKELGMLD